MVRHAPAVTGPLSYHATLAGAMRGEERLQRAITRQVEQVQRDALHADFDALPRGDVPPTVGSSETSGRTAPRSSLLEGRCARFAHKGIQNSVTLGTGPEYRIDVDALWLGLVGCRLS